MKGKKEKNIGVIANDMTGYTCTRRLREANPLSSATNAAVDRSRMSATGASTPTPSHPKHEEENLITSEQISAQGKQGSSFSLEGALVVVVEEEGLDALHQERREDR